jgi:hypothetical protein
MQRDGSQSFAKAAPRSAQHDVSFVVTRIEHRVNVSPRFPTHLRPSHNILVHFGPLMFMLGIKGPISNSMKSGLFRGRTGAAGQD